MNLLKTITLVSLFLGLIACESPQNVEGNTFVGQQGDGVDDTEVQKLNQEADLLLEQGKTKAARKLLFQSLELEENKTTYNSLGIADQLDLNYPSAIAYYEKALAMDSNYVYAQPPHTLGVGEVIGPGVTQPSARVRGPAARPAPRRCGSAARPAPRWAPATPLEPPRPPPARRHHHPRQDQEQVHHSK